MHRTGAHDKVEKKASGSYGGSLWVDGMVAKSRSRPDDILSRLAVGTIESDTGHAGLIPRIPEGFA